MRLVIPNEPTARRSLLPIAGYLAAFGLLHGLSMALADSAAGVLAWQPAVGLSLAAVVLAGPRMVPALLVAATWAAIATTPQLGALGALTIGTGHAIAYGAAGAWLRRRLGGSQIVSVGDVTSLVLVASLTPLLTSLATVSTMILCDAVASADRWVAMFRWWVGEANGILAVSPLVILHVFRADDMPRSLRSGRPLETWEHVGIGGGFVLAGVLTAWGERLSPSIDLAHLLIPPMIWVGLRRGLPGIVAGNALASLTINILPVLLGTPIHDPDNLQLLMFSLSAAAIYFGGAISAMRERSARRRLLMNTIHHGILEADAEGRVTFANAALRELFPLTPGALVGRYLWELSLRPEREQEVRAAFELLRTHQPAPTPWIAETPSGRWIRSDWNYQRDEAGVMTGLVCAITDITEQRRGERLAQAAHADLERQVQRRTAELLDAQARFLAFMDTTPAAAWITLPGGATVFANTAFRREFGDGRADSTLPRVPADLRQQDDRIVRHGLPRQSVVTLAARDGSVREWLVVSFPVPATTGDAMVGGMAFDVTDMRHAERALRDSEERFRFLAEHTSDVIARIDADGTMTYVSPAARGLFGLDPAMMVGKRVGFGMSPAQRDEIEPALDRMLRSGKTQRVTYRSRSADGRTLWLETMSRPVVDAVTGAVREVVTSTRDVTERKAAEEQLRHTERLAAIGTLAAGIAHEINNPLGAIMLLADSARAAYDDADPDGMIDALDDIRAQTVRAGRIVRSILQFARREESRKWPSRLRDAAARARDLVRQAGARGVEIELISNADGDVVLMNPTEMEQVFVNLLRNAIDASPPGAKITIEIDATTTHAIARVVDRGRGMTADERGRAFDPFFTTRHGEGGTGLGLSITHGIVHQHGGRIDIDSAGGRGTTVTIVLPIITAAEGNHVAHPGG